MLIAQVEMDGVFSVRGGMHELAQALTRLAQSRGVRFLMQTPCREIICRHGRAVGVRIDHDELRADAVIFNGEVDALPMGLLGEEVRMAVPRSNQERSLSALTWSMLAPRQNLDLDRHNVFFQSDYASEFNDIFKHRRFPRSPTVYVCAQDRPVVAEGLTAERLFCLVNAPASGDGPELTEEIAPCETTTFDQLHRMGLSIQGHARVRTGPSQFHRRFPASGGSLYGKATHGWMSIFSRPGATTDMPGLYTVGGGTHPGPGVPMAAAVGAFIGWRGWLVCVAAFAAAAGIALFATVAVKGFDLTVFGALALSTGLGVPLGVWAARSSCAHPWIVGVVGVLQTIPALALLAFLIAAMGSIGMAPAKPCSCAASAKAASRPW